ncbi:C-GCAxxG-C-C family (seleno)protein [Clostridium sp. MT-14]|uniref:C-GCAxxG-C-C family protein n=1 Tax=Clostridium aromativorans TaxID=2836848 RepID=A0ABS8N5P1_9CLOT|nr:C-GCAxxG-C-C family (seleno)protein [Clostridium aromativorans]MCC9295119.1 C-GCAxxG-C-C family protein [Clostridium aromativorans]
MKRVLELHKEGYNCAESIVKAINEEKETNIPVSVASPFGSGMTVGSTCGAVTGALMALGSIRGRKTSKESNETRKITKEVINKVKEKYGTFECSELKKKGISCDEIIEYAYDILREYIK